MFRTAEVKSVMCGWFERNRKNPEAIESQPNL
jgi:hypothetical protein